MDHHLLILQLEPGREGVRVAIEKRRHVRTDALKGIRVGWQSGSEHKVSRISDMSLSGLFIETPEPLKIGTIITIFWEAPGREIRARAIVRSSVPGHGMGVEFVAMGTDDRARLLDLLKTAGLQELSKKASTIEQRPPESQPAEPSAGPISPAKTVKNSKALPATPSRARSSEKRSHLRHKMAALIEIVEVESGKRIKAHLGNCGRAGCSVKADNPSSVGTALRLLITKGKQSFQAQARVVYAISGEGMGLLFTAVEAEERRTLNSWLGISTESEWRDANRRKSQRLALAVPVQITGHNSNGVQFMEESETKTISPHGVLVLLSTPVIKGQRLTLSNLRAKAEVECTAVYIAKSQTDKYEVGVAFMMPNRAFWKVAFPPSDWSRQHPDAKGT